MRIPLYVVASSARETGMDVRAGGRPPLHRRIPQLYSRGFPNTKATLYPGGGTYFAS
jgi:hypothetical protein